VSEETEPIVLQNLLSSYYKADINFNCNFRRPRFVFRNVYQNYSINIPANTKFIVYSSRIYFSKLCFLKYYSGAMFQFRLTHSIKPSVLYKCAYVLLRGHRGSEVLLCSVHGLFIPFYIAIIFKVKSHIRFTSTKKFSQNCSWVGINKRYNDTYHSKFIILY
jgi:hypothetical protein